MVESRTDLLNWVNTTLDLSYTKVEQFGTGAVYCQLLDSIYEDVPMNKVNFDSKNEYEHLNNMKVLQLAFNKHGITKKIQVEKLVKCRLQDNLELLQWFKKYWSEHKDFNIEYNPGARRKAKKSINSRASSGNGMVPPGMNGGRVSSAASGTRVSSGARSPVGTRTPSRTGSRITSGARTPGSVGVTPGSVRPGTGASRRVASNPINGTSAPESSGPANTNTKLNQLNGELADANEQIRVLSKENDDYKISLGALETERNFYYNKLRQIEVFANNKLDELNEDVAMEDTTQTNGDAKTGYSKQDVVMMLNQVNEYLYATSEGFQENDQEDMEEGDIDAESF